MQLDEKEFIVVDLKSGASIHPSEVLRLPSGNIRASFVDGACKVSTTFCPHTFKELSKPEEFTLKNRD